MKSFSALIALLAVVSSTTAFHLSGNGEYDDCYKACPDIYLPVCGFDGIANYKLFASDCLMETENCVRRLQKAIIFLPTELSMCEEPKPVPVLASDDKKSNCLKICTFDYRPVCGFDGTTYTTYGNMCGFEVADCLSNFGLTLMSNTECPSETPVTKELQQSNNNAEYDECYKVCPDIYLPVCGFDGIGNYKLFASDCLMETENCVRRLQKSIIFLPTELSMCEEPKPVPVVASDDKKSNCLKICTFDYRPVCGFDGTTYTTYGNMCGFEVADCLSNFGLTLMSNTECPSETPVTKELQQSNNNAEYDECFKVCPDIYLPVCGFDGIGNYKLFASDCLMETENCVRRLQKSIIFLPTELSMCEEPKPVPVASVNKKSDCLKICTFDYRPVCGFDGTSYKTYGNMCGFEVADCLSNFGLTLMSNTECPPEAPAAPAIKEECLKPCPLNYLPVCGFDGNNYHTYSNMCDFEVMNCNSGYHLRMTRSGEC